MPVVSIRIHGKEYNVACDAGQEERLQQLAFELDDRVRSLAYQMGGSAQDVMLLLLSGLMLCDEQLEAKRELERLQEENRYLASIVQEDKQPVSGDAAASAAAEARLLEMEQGMAETLAQVAERIESIAGQLELR